MAPSPQETVHGPSIGPSGPLSGNEVVISGISGIFPSSENISQFKENLFNKVDMVTTDALDLNQPQAPKHVGKINGTNKFDAQFFRVSYNQATAMEPMSRMLLEQAYSAMYDSGINPLAYKGKKVGVFVGTSFSDTSNLAMYTAKKTKGLTLSGCAKTMFANRISYWIDGKGPSYALDCACASSMVCLEHAYASITKGECEAAIVGGCNLCLNPYLGFNLRSGGFVSVDGKTKCFDKQADGYVRAEAVNVIFLQKAKDAKRIYAEVCHAAATFGLEEGAEFLPFRKSEEIEKFLDKFYLQANVSPKQVEYVEAQGTATKEADEEELTAVENVFTKENAVKIGCVKSNMGNSESASGVCAVTKICLAYHEGKLPANLHFTEPLDTVATSKKLHVVTDNEHFNRGYSAVNNFSFSGINCHVLLKGHYKVKETERYKSSIPRLVTVSGRQEDAVGKILDYLKNKPIDPEEIGMFHNIYKIETPGHMCRGYTLIDTNENNETVNLAQSMAYYPGGKRPLWLVFSGMGSQWPGMAADLMQIPTFAKAIQRCHNALLPKGVDLIKVITEPDDKMFDSILNCFIGIAAVQVGLIDILKEIGINPDYVIGHSQGEMGCAYFDNCFTTEEMILAAYSRGYVSAQTEFARGSMAAVGLGYKDILPLCPPEVDVACHNSAESATISGPVEVVKNFVAELTAKGIFARQVPSANIAFHSRYIAHAGPSFIERLREFYKKPKPRSSKWICTSIPQEKWEEPLAKYSSPEFHTNNLMSPVYFEEGAKLIPENAVVVEVAPHGLLQAILKRSHPECTHIPLTRRGQPNQVKFFLEAIGKIYQEGYDLELEHFYPKIEYPVGTETPLLSHLIEWEHSEDWPESGYQYQETVTTSAVELFISTQDDEHEFFTGHIRDGVNVFPETAILVYVWKTFAMFRGVDFNKLSVVFREVQFYGEAIMKSEEPLKLNLMVNRGNDRFEVSHNKSLLASGFIAEVSKPKYDKIHNDGQVNKEAIFLKSEDVYKILHSKGFAYKNQFQSIISANLTQNTAQIKWTKNWITFLDSLIQLNVLTRDYEGISTPKIIKKLTINAENHFLGIQKANGNDMYLDAQYHDIYQIIRCAGVELKYITFNDRIIKQKESDVLESSFVPHFITGDVSVDIALRICLQVVTDNIIDDVVTVTEVANAASPKLSDIIKVIINSDAKLNVEVKTIAAEKIEVLHMNNVNKKPDILIVQNLLEDEKKVYKIIDILAKDAFILTIEKNDLNLQKHKVLKVVCSMHVKDYSLILLKRAELNYDENTIYMNVDSEDRFSWVPRLQNELQKLKRIVLVSERQPCCGLVGFVKKLRKTYKNVSLVVVDDYHAPTFSPETNIYSEQLQKNLGLNIFKKAHWGGYYNLPISKSNNVEQFRLTSPLLGDINSLTWTEMVPVPNNNLVQVRFAGPSVRDAEKAVGIVEAEDNLFGMDFSGVDNKGNKIMGLVSGGAISSSVKPDTDLLWPVPDHWTMEEAATVPLPYVHAYYILALYCELRRGQTVFVNGGTGAIGQAVISICLALDCTVFTSVSSLEKKKFLLRLFPSIRENNIGYSRNGDFHSMVVINSGNKLCDFVINSESGPSRIAAMKCVSQCGCFIDISSYDMTENKDFGMDFVCKERSYKSIKLHNLFKLENASERKLLQSLVAEGIAKGIVRPLSRVIYPTTDVHRAFRLLSSNNRGRVLIKIKDDTTIRNLSILPRISCSSHRNYIVVCDESNLGIDLADRLVKRGARNLIFNVRSKFITGYLQFKLATWKKLKVTVNISNDNLQFEDDCIQFLKESENSGQIQGIYIIQESNSEKNEDLQEALVEKADRVISVVANLDLLSRNICPVLSDFVIITRPSQNIVDEYAISASEKICQARSEVELPALTLRVELLNELHKNEPNNTTLNAQSIGTALDAMEISLKLKYNNVSTYNVRHPKTEFLTQVAQILGIQSLENIDETITINDFIINEVNIVEIRTAIKRTYGIYYYADTVREMTIAELKKLTNVRVRQNKKFDSGLGVFCSFIDEDEYTGADMLVPMRTLQSGCQDETIEGKSACLMLIPGFEGHHHIFKSLSERLKVRAVTLQLAPDMTHDSIPAMASCIVDLILKRFEANSKFYLLGYSFGVNIALELAALLEKQGRVGIVYCLDSSPDALKIQLNAYIGNLTKPQLQNTIISQMYTLMTGRGSEEIDRQIEDIEDWSEKIDLCINTMKKYASYTTQYARYVIKVAFERLMLAKDYHPNFKLKSELVLIKGIPHPEGETLADDYNLSKYSTKPVRVFDIASDHAMATEDCRVPNIVNKLLDPILLEEFEKMNLCETYNYNSSLF